MKLLNHLLLISAFAMLFHCHVQAQNPNHAYVYFYNKKEFTEQIIPLNKNCVVLLKKAPVIPALYPEPLTDTLHLYQLKLTGQMGQTLVFNDSIFVPYFDISYIQVKHRHYALKLISTFSLIVPVSILTPWVLNYTTVVLALASAVPFVILFRDKSMYISPTNCILQTQNNPEQLFKNKPQHQGKWPELKNRY